MFARTTDSVSLTDAQRVLEQQLEDRLVVLRELEQFAAPNIDAVAYQSAASHRIAIEQITAALNRIAQGTYGRCTTCDRQIAPARLAVLPSASACIECQSLAEAA
jgi:RNA polymerase-binding transcription factor DksA